MNARVIAGVIVGALFVVGALAEPAYLAPIMGSAVALGGYIRLRGEASAHGGAKLWAVSALGAIVGGLLVVWASSTQNAAAASGEATGAGLVWGIPLAASAQLILSGRAQFRRCPHCAERIQKAATVWRHCRRDVAETSRAEAV